VLIDGRIIRTEAEGQFKVIPVRGNPLFRRCRTSFRALNETEFESKVRWAIMLIESVSGPIGETISRSGGDETTFNNLPP
jgi:hypothetical protein